MPRHLSVLALSLLLVATAACERNAAPPSPPATAANAEAPAPVAAAPATPPPAAAPDDGRPGRLPQPLGAQQLDLLRQHLGESDARALAHYMDGYQQVTTDAQFAAHYDQGVALFAELLGLNDEGEGRPAIEAPGLEAALAQSFALRVGCAAECTQLDLSYDLDDLARLAARTSGDLDDRFVALKRQAEGSSHAHFQSPDPDEALPDIAHYRPDPLDLNIINQTWDYGGSCLFGNGASLRFLTDSWRFLQDTQLFNADIRHLRDTWLASIINNGTYELGKDKVMAELGQILAAGILTTDETQQLQTLQNELERGSNEHGVPFEFDCGEQECAVG